MVGRDHFVIVGEIVPGGGIVHASDILGEPVHTLGRQVMGGLEHHVFEQVGESGPACGVILGPHPVPDLDGDIRRRRVTGGENLHPVGQGAFRELDRRNLVGCRRSLGCRRYQEGADGGGGKPSEVH